MERDIEGLIRIVRENCYDYERFLNGQCYQFFKLMKTVFPTAEAWSDCDHVITKIGNQFYDITGEVALGDHLPIDSLEEKRYNGLKQKTPRENPGGKMK